MEKFSTTVDGVLFSFTLWHPPTYSSYVVHFKNPSDGRDLDFYMVQNDDGFWRINSQVLPRFVYDIELELIDAIEKNAGI